MTVTISRRPRISLFQNCCFLRPLARQPSFNIHTLPIESTGAEGSAKWQVSGSRTAPVGQRREFHATADKQTSWESLKE
jgi:hypothetical protein